MKIERILNNNVVLVITDEQREAVVMGRGLAFQAKVGQKLNQEKVEKIFPLKKNEDPSRLARLLSEISQEYFDMTEEFVDYAKKRLEKELHNSIYVTLTDHINTMVERAKVHAYIKNTMLWDIKRLYRNEFNVAQEIIEQFNRKIGSAYDDHEAASIAMHLVNAETEVDFETSLNITKVITEILSIVKYQFKIIYDEESLSYYRFVVHLRFFSERLFSGKTYDDGGDEEFWSYLQMKYKEAYHCALIIRQFISDNYSYSLGNEEYIYLTIHIAKVVSDSKAI